MRRDDLVAAAAPPDVEHCAAHGEDVLLLFFSLHFSNTLASMVQLQFQKIDINVSIFYFKFLGIKHFIDTLIEGAYLPL